MSDATEPLFHTPTRQSIQPTYDHRETGDRYTIWTSVNDRPVSAETIRDPFITHRVTVGWRDLIRSIAQRRLVVVVTVSGDREIVEDVCELDDDYTGRHDSTRRYEWRKQVEAGLREIQYDVLTAPRTGAPPIPQNAGGDLNRRNIASEH